ncbi:MAG: FtsX-like permease family protein [Holdemania massiliensis]
MTLIIILTGSNFLIYNAFAISLAERSRQFGLLASIGATARQKFWCVVQEGLMIALIAVPIGLFAGWCGMAVTLKIVN